MLESNVVKFVVIRNPMVPDERLHLEREWEAEKTLHDYIGELQGRYAIAHNGAVIEQHSLSEHTPQAGDVIVICPVLHGGGGDKGKMIMRLVATVALTYFTWGVGTGTMTALWTGTQTGLAAAQVAVAIGGTLLINAVLPPTMDVDSGSDSSSERSPNYGIDGAKNSSEDNIPFPLVYGRHRVGGNVIGSYTEQEGQTQFLNMLICAGEGVIAGIDADSLLLDDQPYSQLHHVPDVKVYRGHERQTISGKFTSQKVPVQITLTPEMKDPNVWTEYVTSVENQVEQLIANFSGQIGKIDGNGKDKAHTVPIEIQYAKEGTEDWRHFQSGVRGVDYDRNYLFLYVDDTTLDRFDATNLEVTKVKVGSQKISDQDANIYLPHVNRYARTYRQEDTDKYGNRTVVYVDWEEYELDGVTYKESTHIENRDYTEYRRGHGNEGGENIFYDVPLSHELFDHVSDYDYGDLYYDGKKVGVYHDFHKKNVIKVGFNDTGLSGGLKSAAITYLKGDTTSTNTRYTFSTPVLDLGRYKVRARRINAPSTSNFVSDDVYFNEVVEVVNSKINYVNTALLELRIRISDQISNIPNITYDHLGQVIRVWHEGERRWVPSFEANEAEQPRWFSYFPSSPDSIDAIQYGLFHTGEDNHLTESGSIFPDAGAFDRPAHTLSRTKVTYNIDGEYQHSNPAWIALDILTHPRYGGNLPVDRIDFHSFLEWAKFCEENNLQFRGVFAERSNVWDVISQVFKVGRAAPVRTGTKYGAAVEMSKQPVMRFGQDNIIKDTFSTSWLSFDDRANELELTFYDEKMDYRARTIKVYEQSALENGAKAINSSVTVRGIVTEERAIREAIFMLNYNKLVQTVTFEAPIESLACAIGDVILVQHNMMNWGHAGKIVSAVDNGDGTHQIELDQEIILESGQNWQFSISSNMRHRGDYNIYAAAVYSNYVALTGFDKNTSVKRAIINGEDYAVLDTYSDDAGNQGVVLDCVTVPTSGLVSLYDTDVIEKCPATPSAYDIPTATITVTGLSSTPERYSGYLVGFENYEARPFTVRSIGLTGSAMTREITALEYDERVLDDTSTDFTVEDVVVERPLTVVTNIEIAEHPFIEGFEQKVQVTLSWIHDDLRYRDASVTVRITGSGDRYLGRHVGHVSFDTDPGRFIEVFITPNDQTGKEGITRVFTHTTIGGSENPFMPANVYVHSISGGAKIEWDSTHQHLHGTEVFAIPSGTLIDSVAIDDWTIENLTEEQIISNAKNLGVTSQESFVHIIDSDTEDAVNHFYWVRSLDRKNIPSILVYGGKSTPYTSVSYNTVTVYRWSELDLTVADRPTGGTYEDPNPNEPEWSLEVIALAPDAPSGTKLWQSSRKFANLESKSASEWSIPSYISNPSENEFTYTWTAYADDIVGTNLSFSKLDTTRYIGHAYNQTEAEPSTNYQDYEWTLLLTDPGDIAEITESSLADIFNLTQTVIERQFEREEMFGPDGIGAGLFEREEEIQEEERRRLELENTLYAKIDEDKGAIQLQIQEVESNLNASWSALESLLLAQYEDSRSYVEQQQAALANTDMSLSLLEETLRSEIGDSYAELTTVKQSLATLDGTYIAQWGVNTDVNGLKGGVGFYNNGDFIEFVVDADIFAVRDAGTSKTVFSVVDGKTVIDDAFINEAYIQQLTADYINATSIEADSIKSNATIDTVHLIGSGTIKFGANGPFGPAGDKNYQFYVNEVGYLYANGGQFSNVVIDESCTVAGSTISLPKLGADSTDITIPKTGTVTLIDKNIDYGSLGKFTCKMTIKNTVSMIETQGYVGSSATYHIYINNVKVRSVTSKTRSGERYVGEYCCGSSYEGDCSRYCDRFETYYYISLGLDEYFEFNEEDFLTGENNVRVELVTSNLAASTISKGRSIFSELIELI